MFFCHSAACLGGPGKFLPGQCRQVAAKMPPRRDLSLLRAFSRVFFCGCLFPAKCIRLCDPVFWQSKRKPKNCWHLQQNFVFCVIAITRPRTGNSFKTGLGWVHKVFNFPNCKKLPLQSHIHTVMIFIMSIYFSHSLSGGQWPCLLALGCVPDSDPSPDLLPLPRHSHSQRGKCLKHFHQADKTDLILQLCKRYKKSFSIFSC